MKIVWKLAGILIKDSIRTFLLILLAIKFSNIISGYTHTLQTSGKYFPGKSFMLQ